MQVSDIESEVFAVRACVPQTGECHSIPESSVDAAKGIPTS